MNANDHRQPALPLEAYRHLIALDEPWQRPSTTIEGTPEDAAYAVVQALREDQGWQFCSIDVDAVTPATSRDALRALLTVRPPGPLPEQAQRLLGILLDHERRVRGEVAADVPSIAETEPDTHYPARHWTALWQGDITTLAVDAIVNAANEAMLGCRIPFHLCIDNVIHNAAGPLLRDDCHAIMRLQGHPEPTGDAKITRGYHLPARFVLHTVGPIVQGRPTEDDAAALASSYTSCLDLSAEAGLRSVAFCSVSTGVFGYPLDDAVRVALAAVDGWLRDNAEMRVIFNVFADDALAAYRRALATWRADV